MQQQRKDEHLALSEKLFKTNTEFQNIRFIHHSLPESKVSKQSIETNLFNKHLPTPLYINAMTGGSKKAKQINKKLAQLAAQFNLPIATGSMSAAIKMPETIDTFTILRDENPNGLIFANIGAEYSLKKAQAVVDLIDANALQLHVNVAQELVMPEGNRSFYVIDHIKEIQQGLSVPVIIKEVGFGMSKETYQQLEHLGIQYVDLSGRGGTNFAAIENQRSSQNFQEWLNIGQTTPESLLEAQDTSLTLFASGGIQTPMDAIKSIALGGDYVGIAGILLHFLLHHSIEETQQFLENWIEEMTRLMALLGAHNLNDLKSTDILLSQELVNYCVQRQIDYKHFAQRSTL